MRLVMVGQGLPILRALRTGTCPPLQNWTCDPSLRSGRAFHRIRLLSNRAITREERGYTAMHTQLLRYTMLIEYLTFLPIPPTTRDFGQTGRTHRLQPTPLCGLLAEGKRAQTGLLLKALRHTRREPEPCRWAAEGGEDKITLHVC